MFKNYVKTRGIVKPLKTDAKKQIVLNHVWHMSAKYCSRTTIQNTQGLFAANGNMAILDWPSCSSDVNLVKIVWAFLKDHANKTGQKTFQTWQKIETSIYSYRDSITSETLQSLAE